MEIKEVLEKEREMFLYGIELQYYIDEEFTNIHDLRRKVGEVLRKLDLEGKISYSSKEDFKFSDHVSREAWDWSVENKPPAKAMDLRRAAIYFATLADAFAIIEKHIDKVEE